MGETPDQIATHIEATRQSLYDDMQALERKVRSIVDWHEHVSHHPMVSLILALGAGMFLAHRVSKLVESLKN